MKKSRKRKTVTMIVTDEKILRQKSTDIESLEEAKEVADKLLKEFTSLKKDSAVGLSAIQIGIPKRMFITKLDDGNIKIWKNPKLVWFSEEVVHPVEGCLSFPGISIRTSRSEYITVDNEDEDGVHEYVLEGMESIVFQHELDHLNGVLMFDRVAKLEPAKSDKVGRNEPCPCGSGKKYKKCHGVT